MWGVKDNGRKRRRVQEGGEKVSLLEVGGEKLDGKRRDSVLRKVRRVANQVKLSQEEREDKRSEGAGVRKKLLRAGGEKWFCRG